MSSFPQNLEDLERGGKRAIAQVLSAIEANADDPQLIQLLDCAHNAAKGHVLGLTGPPGVGKSTLVAAMIRHFRENNKTVGVIAVDPSSKISGGALLGDRLRLNADPSDDGVFIRSFSNQGRLGGLSAATYAAMVLMRAHYDQVIIETVGVGQSESAIADIADTIVLCIQPASGDSIQFMKSGIMELPHIIVVTKADLKAVARLAFAEVEGALELRLKHTASDKVSVCLVSASTGEGIAELMTLISQHLAFLEQSGKLPDDHQIKADMWIKDVVLTRFGEDGWQRAQSFLAEIQQLSVFSRKAVVIERLRGANSIR